MGYDEDTRQVAAEAKFLSNDEAREATENEHSMSLWQSVKLYPKAVAWSMFFSLGTIMTAFDPQLLGNLFAVPKFQQDFGYLYQGQWTISAAWETGLTMGNPIGQGKLLSPFSSQIIDSNHHNIQSSVLCLQRIPWSGTDERRPSPSSPSSLGLSSSSNSSPAASPSFSLASC